MTHFPDNAANAALPSLPNPPVPVGAPTTRSLDNLLAKYATTAPQEEPDPTGPAILPELLPQLNKWLKGHVSVSEIKKLQERAES